MRVKVGEFRPDALMEDVRPSLDRRALDLRLASCGIVTCTVAGVVARLDGHPVLAWMYLGAAVLWIGLLRLSRSFT